MPLSILILWTSKIKKGNVRSIGNSSNKIKKEKHSIKGIEPYEGKSKLNFFPIELASQ